MIRRTPAESAAQPRLRTLARRDAIAQLATESDGLSVQELASRFGVSAMTIRRDLDILDHQCRLLRVHGGAVPITKPGPMNEGQDALLCQFDRLVSARPQTGAQLLAEVVHILSTYLPRENTAPHRPRTRTPSRQPASGVRDSRAIHPDR